MIYNLNGDDKVLEKLIQEGENVRKTCTKEGMIGEFVVGEEYEKWIAKGILFMERTYPDETITKRFVEASKNAAGQSVSHLDTMMGILKALNEYEG